MITNRLKKLLATASLATAVLTTGPLLAQPAHAASNVAKNGAPGAVYEDSLPVRCIKQFYSGQLHKSVVADGPTVYAARLGNGSTQQYVTYQENVYDSATKRFTNGPWSSWALASTSQGVKLANQMQEVNYNTNQAVQIVIMWWDPVSKQYTGEMDYLVSQYYHFGYGDNSYNVYSYC